jgi:hypothetical protein
MLKLFVQKLDNGYTLTITTEEDEVNREGQPILVEVKTRLVFETKEGLSAKLQEVL